MSDNLHRIQGPSIESWSKYILEISGPGTDSVPSIRCNFWPTSASEWTDRQRHCGWPSSREKERILSFGCHLVPVGHPMSPRKSVEWRLSFSIPEKFLVWSFNHTQLQCYAILKFILKEFVKINCSKKHADVLCSYFIKTFLFWQFEKTDTSFWQPSNFRRCFMYLLNEFRRCIQCGVLRHYFIARFNLLEIKLTPGAQAELVHIFDVMIQNDMLVLGQCASLSGVWNKSRKTLTVKQIDSQIRKTIKHRLISNDEGLISVFATRTRPLVHFSLPHYHTVFRAIDECHTSTSLPILFKILLRFLNTIEQLNTSCLQGNKSLYNHIKTLDKNVYGTDIASSKLWLATFLVKQRDYCGALQKINNALSSIPPNALYEGPIHVNVSSNRMYEDIYSRRGLDTLSRAKEAWLLDIWVTKAKYPYLPQAIQIELYYTDPNVVVFFSPFTYAYYLLFLCCHELGQYDNRDHALRQLLDTLKDEKRRSVLLHHAL